MSTFDDTSFLASQEELTPLRLAERRLREEADDLQIIGQWLENLVTLSVALARSFDPGDVLRQVVAEAVDSLGARHAAVVLVDEGSGGWDIAASDATFQRAGNDRLDQQHDSLIELALSHQAPVFDGAGRMPIGAGLDGDGGAVAVLPLGDPTTYAALVLTFVPARPFRPTTQAHLSLLAHLTTLTHRKAQAMERQYSLASELQAALLPTLGVRPGLELAWQYLAVADHAVVGGDWYDAVDMPGGRVALFVGDVVGHGPPAAALMGEIRFTTRGLVRAFSDPGRLLDELDAALLHAHPPGQAMATLCASVIEPDGTLLYSSAGHPHPVVRRADGRVDVLGGARSRILGASLSGEPRTTATDGLAVGDCLVAFSDGVFERRGTDYDDAYGALLERLRAARPRPLDLCDAVVGDRLADPEHAAFRDDVVVLAARWTGRQ